MFAVAGAIVVKENVDFVGATMRSGIAVTEGGRRRTNIRGGVRRCEKGDIKNAMPKIVDKAGRVW